MCDTISAVTIAACWDATPSTEVAVYLISLYLLFLMAPTLTAILLCDFIVLYYIFILISYHFYICIYFSSLPLMHLLSLIVRIIISVLRHFLLYHPLL